MADREYQVPDLASVLRTLAAFTPPDPQKTQEISLSTQPPPFPQNPTGGQAPIRPGPEVPGPKVIDPATITDWPSGLRCVMKTVAAHENIIKEIRRMIKVQQEHEEQWWNGRVALLQRQAAREESQKKLNEVLRAVGGAVTEEKTVDCAEEISVFDGKVHRAQVQMVKEMSVRLKSFGVPFFGTRSELVRAPGEAMEEEGNGGKKIGEEELVELQRRMIGILEDLCSE